MGLILPLFGRQNRVIVRTTSGGGYFAKGLMYKVTTNYKIVEHRTTMRESTRTDASRHAREFAIAFTFAVTEASTDRLECIAKNGKDSIFATLKKIYPEVSHPKDQTRAKKSTIVCLYYC